MFERRLLRHLDWLLVLAVIAASLLGLAMIYSASFTNHALTGGDRFFFVRRQVMWLGVGLVLALLCVYIDYRRLARWDRWIYALVVLGLLVVAAKGEAAGGAARWIGLGPFRLQPSEFAKLGLIITFAAMLSRRQAEMRRPATLAQAALHLGVPAALIALQPDLGTALVIVMLWFVMLFLAGAPKRYLVAAAVGLAVVFAGAWHFDILRPYQKARLAIFLDPSADPLDTGYHVIQSKIAVGSGQLVGKGYLHGTQSQLHFIPAQHTDFIFTVVGEELGFAGAACLLGLFLVLLWRGLAIMDNADDALGRLIAGGVVAMLAFQLLVNVGMTMSIMPVTGLPLPLISYGGSSLLMTLMAVGVLLNIGMRRQRINF